MRHIKMFNELNSFISSREIKDICLELEDLGYNVDIDDYPNRWSTISCNKISHDGDGNEIFVDLNWGEIKDCFLRLKDYLNYRFEIFRFYEGEDFDLYYLNLSEDTNLGNNIKEVVIEYQNEGIV